MPFDYKKEYKAFYMPAKKPEIITIPAMNFVAVRGKGDPNAPDGAYQHALAMLYAVAFTIKMSKLSDHRMEGYFDYVVPPLEGLWRQEDADKIDYAHKERFEWISMIRLPDFVSEADFRWAVQEAERKKQMKLSAVELLRYDEGLCVQCMHIGPYDDEPATIEAMTLHAHQQGYRTDINAERWHHEIYLSDARRTQPERLRTVIRHPVCRE